MAIAWDYYNEVYKMFLVCGNQVITIIIIIIHYGYFHVDSDIKNVWIETKHSSFLR